MNKYAVTNEVLHEELRNEEANLMQQMQAIMANPAKVAYDQSAIESKLQQVRAKITELDTKNSAE